MSSYVVLARVAALLALPVSMYAQLASPACNITSVPALVRAEGVAERLGDLVISCSGTPGRSITGNLSISLNTTITNHVLQNGNLDVVLTVDGVPGGAATLAANNQVTFAGLTFAIGTSGSVQLRITNLRGDASFGGATATTPGTGGPFIPSQPIVAQLAFSPGGLLNFTTTNFQIGVPQRSILATSLSAIVPSQFGSALPEILTFPELLRAGTFFSTTRVSEGHISAWQPRQANEDTGTRIMLRFSGYPSDARLLVPAAIAGSNAAIPTRAGDFGGTVSGGSYVPGSGTLLLVRVLSTDANGGGGYPATGGTASGTGGVFETMTEVTLAGGSGVAVYEVADASSQIQESAQIPVFIGLPRSQNARNVTLGVQTVLAPISTSAIANTTSTIPRFINAPAQSDCTLYRDCGTYTPKLGAPPINTQFRLVQGVGVEQRIIPLTNEGAGMMPWTATVEYKSGRDWILLDRSSELQAVPIRMIVRALADLPPATYEATVVIDAGPAGVARYPVTLVVLPIPVTAPPAPRVISVVHGATFEAGPIVRGSYLTLRGENFSGNTVAVSIDGKPSRVVFSNGTQINVQVPAELTGNTAQIVVTVNGTASTPVMANVAPVNPGVFNPGIVNQDGSVNSPTNPAATGTFVQIYATGLLAPDGTGLVDAKLHDQILTTLPYAGPAPNLSGIQQVNLKVPEGWPTMTTEVLVCGTVGGVRTCSPPAKIHIRQAQ